MRSITTLSLALLAGLAACGGAASEPAPSPDGSTATKAPEFTGTGLDGKPVKLSDYRGKPVLLNFWFYH